MEKKDVYYSQEHKYCGSRRVDAPLEGFVWDARAAAMMKAAYFDLVFWHGDVLGDILDESLSAYDTHGRRFP